MPNYNSKITPTEDLSLKLNSLTVLDEIREFAPIYKLCNTLTGIRHNFSLGATCEIRWCYHDFIRGLVWDESPPITGDRWQDFLLHAVLKTVSPFSIAAARGKVDAALRSAMERDLRILQQAFLLDDFTLRSWCQSFMTDGEGDDTSQWISYSGQGLYILEGDSPLLNMQRLLLTTEVGAISSILLWISTPKTAPRTCWIIPCCFLMGRRSSGRRWALGRLPMPP